MSLVSDGWSNIRREHMVNYVVVTPNHKPVLLGTEETTGVAQDAPEIANALSKVIEEIGVTKVAGVVTDNAANMVAAWKILEQKYPSVIVNGCGAHTINLLVKDICKLPVYANSLENARDITSFILGRGQLRKRLATIQKRLVEDGEMLSAKGLVYVGETRWYTHHSCVRRLLDTRRRFANWLTREFLRKSRAAKRRLWWIWSRTVHFGPSWLILKLL